MGVILDPEGNLYGTTVAGGQTIFGTVFKLSPSGVKTILYNFLDGTDGAEPHGMLVRDTQGNLYGTTEYGGNLNVQCSGMQGCGVVFKISPSGHESVLHRFTGNADGGQLLAGLTIDSAGNLYGTASCGGASSCSQYYSTTGGVVFKIDSAERMTVLHAFSGSSDGEEPQSSLILDTSGNLYGSTTSGGAETQGTIFKVDSNGHETVLLSFGGTFGSQPYGSLALDSKGDLYGATYNGGNLNDCDGGCGIVFELKPDGQEPILDVFTGDSAGGNPLAGLLRDKGGNLYGTAASGGEEPYSCGVAFQITPKGIEQVLHSFTGGADGCSPNTNLTQDSSGNLYGGAFGGTYGAGVIFEITP